MKINTKYITIMFLVFVLAGCQKGYNSINQENNQEKASFYQDLLEINQIAYLNNYLNYNYSVNPIDETKQIDLLKSTSENIHDAIRNNFKRQDRAIAFVNNVKEIDNDLYFLITVGVIDHEEKVSGYDAIVKITYHTNFTNPLYPIYIDDFVEINENQKEYKNLYKKLQFLPTSIKIQKLTR